MRRSVHSIPVSTGVRRDRARPIAVAAVLVFVLLGVSPRAPAEAPDWFAHSLLDLREDIAEAAQDGRRVMLYFWQDACAPCEELVDVTFRDPGIVARLQRDFMPVALHIRGDREVTWIDGRTMSEKRFAGMLGVWGTPTLIFLDEHGGVALRLAGYVSPAQLAPVLEAAARKPSGTTPMPARAERVRAPGPMTSSPPPAGA